MNLVKLTYDDLTLWISVEEICYMSREAEIKPSSIIQLNEKKAFTIVALKSGRNIQVKETPEEIIAQINGK